VYELGETCPRDDPDKYHSLPYVEERDPLLAEAAAEIERLRASYSNALVRGSVFLLTMLAVLVALALQF